MEKRRNEVSEMRCLYCGEELKFVEGKGWVHQNGKLYKTKIVNGQEVDDHCARPLR